MQLNAEQRRALKQGEPVAVIVDEAECVMIRRDIYDRERNVFSPRDTYAAVEAVLDQEEDPGLASYQHYKHHPRPDHE